MMNPIEDIKRYDDGYRAEDHDDDIFVATNFRFTGMVGDSVSMMECRKCGLDRIDADSPMAELRFHVKRCSQK